MQPLKLLENNYSTCALKHHFREGAKQIFKGNLEVCVKYSKTMAGDLYWCFVVKGPLMQI